MANPLAIWLTVDQLSCKFDNIGGVMPPHPELAHPCCLEYCKYHETKKVVLFQESQIFAGRPANLREGFVEAVIAIM